MSGWLLHLGSLGPFILLRFLELRWVPSPRVDMRSNYMKAASALALLLLLTLSFIRKLMYEFFWLAHRIFAFVAVLALLVHLLPTGSQGVVFPAVALALWGFNAILRVGRMGYINIGGRKILRGGQATITHFFEDTEETEETVVSAMRVTVHLRKPLKMRPDQYVYLYFSGMGTRQELQSHPYVIAWWDDSLRAMSLSFLIQPQSGISAELMAMNWVKRVTVDGPYGKNLQLETYETVILIAKGIGIAGIISHIRHMTYRRASEDKDHETYRRGLITRKIDVYWVMEDNCQEDWISEWIIELHERDSKRVSL
jgi:predicted ferric reductase